MKGYYMLVCVPRICRRFLKFAYVVVRVCMGKVYSLLVRGVSRRPLFLLFCYNPVGYFITTINN